MITIDQIEDKARELKAVKYAYKYLNQRDKSKDQSRWSIHYFNDKDLEVVGFPLSCLNTKGFELNTVFPDGRYWGLDNAILLGDFKEFN